jgi:Zn-dependent protease
MFKLHQGSFRLFRLAGIDVFLHWTWLVVAYFQISRSADKNIYSSPLWNVAEYLSLFGIVLLHEFGHALACRQVGGTANRIVLWPLGGIAFVNPPPRPGAFLWSIAAGPLVNVMLLPLTWAPYVLNFSWEWEELAPDLYQFCLIVASINTGLLIFNLLPIYPLDGGQILQALLWFVMGYARSLGVVSVIGLAGGILLFLATLSWMKSIWLGVLAAFVVLLSLRGFAQARTLARLAKAPRRPEAACPSCGAAPVLGAFWGCDRCGTRFDTFEQQAVCPRCGKQFAETMCLNCHQSHALADWFPAIVEVVPEDDGKQAEPGIPPEKPGHGEC